VVNDDIKIRFINENERIKYLGCSFNSELVFDNQIIIDLIKMMNNIMESPIINREQKLNILNQYLISKLIYPLQAAPLNKIPKKDLDALDVSIRQTAKGILGLPIHNTPTSFLYAPKNIEDWV
jgi:hypothetical protein